jgi:hypothetical protein
MCIAERKLFKRVTTERTYSNLSQQRRKDAVTMEGEDYIGAITETETYDEESSEDETIGFMSYAMLDRLMALKVAEGHESFEALFEQLLKDHAAMRK